MEWATATATHVWKGYPLAPARSLKTVLQMDTQHLVELAGVEVRMRHFGLKGFLSHTNEKRQRRSGEITPCTQPTQGIIPSTPCGPLGLSGAIHEHRDYIQV